MGLLEKISILVQRRPKTILAVISIITVLFCLPLSHLKIETSIKLILPDYINAVGDKWDDIRPKVETHSLIVESLDKSILSLPAVKEQDLLVTIIEHFLKASPYKDVEVKSLAGLLEKKLERKNKSIAAITSQKKLNKLLVETFAESPEEFKKGLQLFLSAEYDREALDRLKKRRKMILSPFLSLFISKNFDFEFPDAKSSPIWFETKNKKMNFKDLAVVLRGMINHMNFRHIRVHHFSRYLIEHDADSKIGPNSLIMGISIVLIIWLIIFVSFKKLYYSVVPILTMALALIWTFGAASLLGIKLTIIHTIVIPLLIGVGVDGPIHLSKRFLDEMRGKGAALFDALRISYRETGFSLFLAALTTILAFVSNIVWPGNSVAFRTLGMTLTIGISFTLILTYLIWGSLLSLKFIKSPHTPLWKRGGSKWNPPLEKGGRGDFCNRLMKDIPQKICKISMAHKRLIMVSLLVLVLASIFSIPFIKTDISAKEFTPKGTQSFSDYAFWERQKPAKKYRQQAILIEGNILDPRLFFALEMLKINVANDNYLERFEGKVMFESVNTLAEDQRKVMFKGANTFVEELRSRRETMSDPKSFYDGLLQNTDTADPLLEITWKEKAENLIFKDSMGNYHAVAANISVDASDEKKVRKAISELEEDIERSGLNRIPGIKASLIGIFFADTKAEAYLRENQFKSFGLAVLLIFLVLIPIYRRVSLSLIVLSPIVIASILTVGLMALLQVSLTFLNVMVIAITIGLGIDYAIYLTGRYLEEIRGHDEEAAAEKALEGILPATWAAALTTIVGFSILSFSFLPIAKSFGLLSAFSLLLSVILTLFLLPILLVRFVKRQK